MSVSWCYFSLAHVLFLYVSTCTSREHGTKEPQLFSHCSSFDHPDLQSLNNNIFVFLVLRLQIEILVACNAPLERYFQDLYRSLLKDPKFLKFQLVNQKTNLHSFTDCRSGWSKEPQWENDCNSFFTMFSTSDVDCNIAWWTSAVHWAS